MRFLAVALISIFLFLNSPAKAANGDFTVSCPAGTYLTGFTGRVGDWIDDLRIICSRWDGRNVLQPVDFSNQIGGSHGGLPQTAECPNNFVVIGQQIFTLRSDNHLVRGINFTCALFESWGSDNPTRSPQQSFGRTNFDFGGSFGHQDDLVECLPGLVGKGITGHVAGIFIDRLAIDCKPTPAQQVKNRIAHPNLKSPVQKLPQQ